MRYLDDGKQKNIRDMAHSFFLHLKSCIKQRKQQIPPPAVARFLRLDTVSPWVFTLSLILSVLGFIFLVLEFSFHQNIPWSNSFRKEGIVN